MIFTIQFYTMLVNVDCYSAEKKIDKQELIFLMTDVIGMENNVPNPGHDWFHDKSWDEICRLDELNAYHGKHRFEYTICAFLISDYFRHKR